MKKFQPSINIVYDTGKSELFDMFVPNTKQLEIMTDVISSIATDSLVNSHLMIGPYGAGKSMVGALTASLMTARKNSKDVKSFLNTVNGLSEDLSNKIQESLSMRSVKWLPVTITGKKGQLDEIILEAIQLKLKAEGIILSLKGDSDQILQTIELWKNEYNVTYLKLNELCKSFGCTIEEMIHGVSIQDETYIIEFKRMYENLTSGATFVSESNTSFVERIHHLMLQLNSKKIGIFIIYDEFGRFLQGVNQSLIFQTMQDLQDISELANRSDNLGLLFITHTGLRQYAAGNNNLSKGELERVEKRFESHRLDSDPSLFYRTAFKILEIVKKDNTPNLFLIDDVERIKRDLRKYDLFPDMGLVEVENFILDKCQPIHPLTIRMLPILSNMLGQNDRTLYTFLSQFEEESLDIDWYFADRLFDYFYPDESSFYLIDDLRYYRLSMGYKISVNAKRIVKLLTLFNIANKPFKITQEFLSFALGLEVDNISTAIEELHQVKLVRYNPLATSYELYSGSILALDSIVDEYRSKTVINDMTRVEFLNKFLVDKYFLPHEYNSVKSMIRFIEAKFLWGNEYDSNIQCDDGLLLYLLYRNEEEYEHILRIIRENRRKDIIICIPNLKIDDLVLKLDEYITLDILSNTPEVIQQDENLESEIIIHLENIKFEIEDLLSPVKYFEQNDLSWFIDSNEVKSIESKTELEKIISNWMFDRYPNTPEIRNEGFNKKRVTTVQKKAGKSILSQLISPTFTGEFDIEGFGPDYLIFATVFKNTGLDFKKLEELENENFAKLRNELILFVHTNKRGKIIDLYDLLKKEPYGIREPLIPLLLVSLIKDIWNQMAFYANDFYIHEMNAEMLYEILELRADFYEYEVYELSSNSMELLVNINDAFFNNVLPIQPVILFTELTKWLRKLPRYTQITNLLGNNEIQFKEIIRHSETDPLSSMEKLEKLIVSSMSISLWKSNLEKHIFTVRESIEEKVLGDIGILSTSEVDQWSDENKDLIYGSSLLSTMVIKMKQSEDWLDYLIEKIVGVPLKDWSDVTYDSFWINLKQLLSSNDQSESIKIVTNNQTVMEIKEVELSVKGKTIYNNVNRIVQSGGKTMSNEEIRFVVYKILSELN